VVLEMISFGWQTRITSNKRAVHCTSRFSWCKRRHHYTANDSWHVYLRSEIPLFIGLSSKTLFKQRTDMFATVKKLCQNVKSVWMYGLWLMRILYWR